MNDNGSVNHNVFSGKEEPKPSVDQPTVAPKMQAFFTEKAIEILLVSKVLSQFQLSEIADKCEKIADDLNEISEFFSDQNKGN